MAVMNDKQKLLRRIQQACFALAEADLYLDSHPTCKMGLEYFRKHKAEKESLEKEYTEKYGPLTAGDAYGDDRQDSQSCEGKQGRARGA